VPTKVSEDKKELDRTVVTPYSLVTETKDSANAF
jgi:hypothetical protein